MPDESRVKPQPLQPEELKEVEARCEAAAPGPWKREGDAVYTAHECGDTCERTLNDHFVFADPDVKPADAEFIAHARTDIPRLIATIEEARREQPVSDEAMDAASVEYANKVQSNLSRPDAFVWMIARNAYLAGETQMSADNAANHPSAVSCTVNHPKDWPCAICGREQPVRVTDAPPRRCDGCGKGDMWVEGWYCKREGTFVMKHPAVYVAAPKEGTDG